MGLFSEPPVQSRRASTSEAVQEGIHPDCSILTSTYDSPLWRTIVSGTCSRPFLAPCVKKGKLAVPDLVRKTLAGTLVDLQERGRYLARRTVAFLHLCIPFPLHGQDAYLNPQINRSNQSLVLSPGPQRRR